MLAEALHYARARLAGQKNPHGHLTELVGIWARQRRQRQAWAGHLARARVLCLAAAEATPTGARRTALVYGAGLLHDVPLEQLSNLFSRVVLADMAFLPATVRLAKTLGNVELTHVDLTGRLDRLPAPEQLAARIPAPTPDLRLGLDGLDFAYSANLLSQLPLHALDTLRKHHPDMPREDLAAYGASLVRAHLKGLDSLPCPACLVTDTLERGLADGCLRYEEDLLFGVSPGLPGETWAWPLAPKGEADPELDVEHLVLGAPDAHNPHTAPAPDGERNG